MNEMKENRTVEMYVAQAIHDALQCQSIKYKSGAYISEMCYRKIMQEVQNCNAKEVNRKLAHMYIDQLINRLAYLCTGGNRTLTTDEKWMVEHTINDLMAKFTGYTIAAE